MYGLHPPDAFISGLGHEIVAGAAIINAATRLIRSYASYIGQVMWIFISFFVLVAFPLLFGIEAYGKFAATTALTFIVQKIIDLTVESNIANGNYRNTIRSAAYAAFLVLAPLVITDAASKSAVYQIEYLLLLSLIASNLVLNISFQLLSAVIRAVYLTIFSALTIGISLAFWLSGSTEISTILMTINFSGCVVGSLFLIHGIRNVAEPESATPQPPMLGFIGQILDVTYRFFFSTFSLFITLGSILIASAKFDYAEIGLFRISLTIVAVGTFISPINPKEMYRIARSIETYADLAYFFRQNRTVYLVFIALWLVAVLYSIFALGDVVGVLIFSTCLYITSLYSTVIEKVFLARLEVEKAAIFVSAYAAVAVLLLFIPQTLEHFAVTISLTILFYPAYLSLILRRGFYRGAIVPISLSGMLLVAAALSRGLIQI